MKKIIILILLSLLLTGCYNYHEIEKTAIIDAISIDYYDNQYYVTFEIIKNTEANNLKLETKHIKGSGKNITTAFYDAEIKINTNPFFNHLELIIINDEIIKNHINDITDYILRNPQINNKALLIGTVNKASDLIDYNQDDVLSNRINGLISNHYNNEVISTMSFNEIVDNNISYGIDSAIPLLTISDSNTYEFIGMMPIGTNIYYNSHDVKMFNILNNNCKNIIINDHHNTIRLINSKTKYDFKKKEINVNLVGELLAYDNDYNDEAFILLLTNELNQFYQLLKHNHHDLLGINQKAYRKTRHQNNIFNNNDFNIKVALKINKHGLTYEVKNEK